MLKKKLGLGTGAKFWGILENGAVVRAEMDSETGKVTQAAKGPTPHLLGAAANGGDGSWDTVSEEGYDRVCR